MGLYFSRLGRHALHTSVRWWPELLLQFTFVNPGRFAAAHGVLILLGGRRPLTTLIIRPVAIRRADVILHKLYCIKNARLGQRGDGGVDASQAALTAQDM